MVVSIACAAAAIAGCAARTPVRLSLPADGGLKVEVLAVDQDPTIFALMREDVVCREGVLKVRPGANWF
jgi:hypothetical protein